MQAAPEQVLQGSAQISLNPYVLELLLGVENAMGLLLVLNAVKIKGV